MNWVENIISQTAAAKPNLAYLFAAISTHKPSRV